MKLEDTIYLKKYIYAFTLGLIVCASLFLIINEDTQIILSKTETHIENTSDTEYSIIFWQREGIEENIKISNASHVSLELYLNPNQSYLSLYSSTRTIYSKLNTTITFIDSYYCEIVQTEYQTINLNFQLSSYQLYEKEGIHDCLLFEIQIVKNGVDIFYV